MNFYCKLILMFLLRYGSIVSESTTKTDWCRISAINLLVDLKRAIFSKGQLVVCRLGGVGRSNRGSPIDKGCLGVVNYQPLIFDVWDGSFLVYKDAICIISMYFLSIRMHYVPI